MDAKLLAGSIIGACIVICLIVIAVGVFEIDHGPQMMARDITTRRPRTVTTTEKPRVEGKVMALTGFGSLSFQKSTEIMDLFNEDRAEKCQNMLESPVPLTGSVGGLVSGNSVFVCGGQSFFTVSDKCWILNPDAESWAESSTLLSPRKDAAAIMINSTTLFVTGGRNGAPVSQTTEFVQPGQTSQPGPNLPDQPLYGHCLVKSNNNNNNKAFLVGGAASGSSFTDKSSILTIDNQQWEDGPVMGVTRAYHSCGIIKITSGAAETAYLIAAGGRKPDSGDTARTSTEIWNMNPNNNWQEAADLPRPVQQAEMVATPDEKELLLIGGADADYSSKILKFSCPGDSCIWSELDMELKTGRHSFIALKIPDTMATCEDD